MITQQYNFGNSFQEKILAILLKAPQEVFRYGDVIKPNYFINPAHTIFADIGVSYYKKFHNTISMEVAEEWLRDRLPRQEQKNIDQYLVLLTNIYTIDITDYKAVLEKVVEFAKQAEMILAIYESAQCIQKNEPEKVRGLIDAAYRVGQDMGDVGVDWKKTIAERVDRVTNPLFNVKIPTGITALDKAIGGGLGRGELGIFLAPAKGYKSMVLQNIAVAAASPEGIAHLPTTQGINVVYYTLELSEDLVGSRIDRRIAQMSEEDMHKNPEQFKLALETRAKAAIKGNILIKRYLTAANTEQMRSHLSMLKGMGIPIGLVVVDYAELMSSVKHYEHYRLEAAGIYTDLRNLAYDFDVPVWSADRCTKEAVKKTVLTMEDFSEAFKKAAVVDMMIAICRTPSEIKRNEGRLFVGLNRNKAAFQQIKCNFNAETMTVLGLGVMSDAEILALEEEEKKRKRQRGEDDDEE